MTNKQALREAAERATESDWIVDAHEGWHAVIPVADAVNGNYIIAEFQGPESKRNRDFVAAANPAAVLALLDELEAAEKKTVEMPTFDGYVPHVARELQAAFRIACDNAGINIAAAGKGE